MIVAYRLSPEENASYMYLGAPGPRRCPACGSVLDRNFVNQAFKLKRKVFDFSYTYDGCCIVSLRFREACERLGLDGLTFLEIDAEPKWFRLIVEKVLAFDTARRRTRFENQCAMCGKFESVAGASPAILKGVMSPVLEGIYRTDIEFGTKDEQHPLLIAGIDTARKLRKEKLTGLLFKPIEAVGSPAEGVSETT